MKEDLEPKSFSLLNQSWENSPSLTPTLSGMSSWCFLLLMVVKSSVQLACLNLDFMLSQVMFPVDSITPHQISYHCQRNSHTAEKSPPPPFTPPYVAAVADNDAAADDDDAVELSADVTSLPLSFHCRFDGHPTLLVRLSII